MDSQPPVHPQEVSPFRQSSPGFTYELTSDLDTSDVPIHLRQTLPKYRYSGVSFTTNEPRYQNNPEHAYSFQPTGTASTKIPQRKPNNPEFSRKYTPVSQSPSPFRPSIINNVKPPSSSSQHRPNYSHLYSQQHIRNPSQTETFLGQITIQSPAELPPEFNNRGFRPSLEFPVSPNKPFEHNSPLIEKNNELVSSSDYHKTNFDYNEKPFSQNTVQLGSGGRGNFLNHRTRIFAPDNNDKNEKSKSKAYFINSNGDVLLTTRSPFIPKQGKDEEKNAISKGSNAEFNPKLFDLPPTKETVFDKKPTTENLHFASLLEDPINKDEKTNHDDDDVEVIKSVTVPPDQFYTLADNPTEIADDHTATNESENAEDYDDDSDHLDDQSEVDHHDNLKSEIEDEEDMKVQTENHDVLDKEEPEHESDGHQNQNDNIVNDETEESETATEEHTTLEEVFTTPEMATTDVIDNEPPATTDANTEIAVTELNSNGNTEEEVVTTLENDVIDNSQDNELNSTQKLKVAENETNDTPSKDAIVSVVTTKSFVNNTMIVTATPTPPVTEQMYSPNSDEEDLTTESWIVIASVQTSRSVSGARYLPSSIVEQEERTKYLNEPEDRTNKTVKNISSALSTTLKPNTSTESLTDKLDRQQSDLSSDLLTGGFKDIPVLKESVQDKPDETVASTTTTQTPRTTKLPPVVIRKFSPNLRRTTTPQARKVFDNAKKDDLSALLPPGFVPRYQKKTTTTPPTITKIDLDEPQNDEPAKTLDLEDLKGRIKFKEVKDLVPSDYKLNKTESINETKTNSSIDKILAKAKPVDISALLPPGYKPPSTTEKSIDNILKKAQPVDISAFLPPGYKVSSTTEKSKNIDNILKKAEPVDISAFLPHGYKPPKENNTKIHKPENSTSRRKPNIPVHATNIDISSLLPKDYKLPKNDTSNLQLIPTSLNITTSKPNNNTEKILQGAAIDDISAFLPPDYKQRSSSTTTTTSKPKNNVDKILDEASIDDISAFLPPGYKARGTSPKTTTTTVASTTEQNITSTTPPSTSGGFKIVFPSRPGGGTRVSSKRLTTSKPSNVEGPAATAPAIQKGWPSRLVKLVY